MSLTVKVVEAARPQKRPCKLTDGGGLYLFVAPTGLKSWRVNDAQDGKQRTRTYGRYLGMTLAQARAARTQTKSAPTDAATDTAARLRMPSARIRATNIFCRCFRALGATGDPVKPQYKSDGVHYRTLSMDA